MTDVQLKLQDAATQMLLAIANSSDEQIFRSCINAFLSHARSVTFVMQAESSDPLLTDWYTTQRERLSKVALMRFFNSQRVHSIHRGVVTPRSTSYQTTESNFRYEAAADGTSHLMGKMIVLSDVKPGDYGDVFHLQPDGTISTWTFEGVKDFIPSDNGNVLRLCEQYFLILKWLVQEWLCERERLISSNHQKQ
jgi:hypothetical protein